MTGVENVGVFIREKVWPNFSRTNTPTFSTPVSLHTYPPMKWNRQSVSETLAYKIQTPGNYPDESIKHSEHGESLKSRVILFVK